MTSGPPHLVTPTPGPSRAAQQVCHTRYCRVVSAVASHRFTFHGRSFELRFSDVDFEPGYGFVVVEYDVDLLGHVGSDVLLWLLVYFGEDTLNPYQEVDTMSVWERGDFVFASQTFDRFIAACGRLPRRSVPKWRTRLFDRALIYFSMAVRSGVSLMPINLGLFGLCLECIGNVHHGRRDRYYTLGEKRLLGLINKRLARYKRRDDTRESARRLQKVIVEDVELIHEFRNAFYGHSLLHLDADRRRLTQLLRRWYARQVKSRAFVNRSFRTSKLEQSVVNEFSGLYKIGLRICRIFIWMTLGFSRLPPFASQDFSIAGDLRVGEVMRGPTRARSARLARD